MFEMLKDRPTEASHRKNPHMIKRHIKGNHVYTESRVCH